MKLAYCNLKTLGFWKDVKKPVANLLGKCFNELPGRSFHHLAHNGHGLLIVNRIFKVVASSGFFKVSRKDQIYFKVIAFLPLFFIKSMIAMELQLLKCELIHFVIRWILQLFD